MSRIEKNAVIKIIREGSQTGISEKKALALELISVLE
jgi:hypothetical protein